MGARYITIWKYPVSIKDKFTLEMPRGARILSIQAQVGDPQLWALVDPEELMVYRDFVLVGTGNPFAFDAETYHYLATFQIAEGHLVFHLFEDVS